MTPLSYTFCSYFLFLFLLFLMLYLIVTFRCIATASVIVALTNSLSTFRVLGLKLLPSIINLFLSPFDLIFIYGILILYPEEYCIGMVDKVSFAVMTMCGLKKVALLVLLSFIFLNAVS